MQIKRKGLDEWNISIIHEERIFQNYAPSAKFCERSQTKSRIEWQFFFHSCHHRRRLNLTDDILILLCRCGYTFIIFAMPFKLAEVGRKDWKRERKREKKEARNRKKDKGREICRRESVLLNCKFELEKAKRRERMLERIHGREW